MERTLLLAAKVVLWGNRLRDLYVELGGFREYVASVKRHPLWRPPIHQYYGAPRCKTLPKPRAQQRFEEWLAFKKEMDEQRERDIQSGRTKGRMNWWVTRGYAERECRHAARAFMDTLDDPEANRQREKARKARPKKKKGSRNRGR